MNILTVVAIGLLGLVFGSFVNALVWRLHEKEAVNEERVVVAKKKDSTKKLQALDTRLQDLSITKGRSMCPACHHTLAAKDLVPVFSWLYLRGKCRYCRATIPDSPVVELAATALFVLAYYAWPLGFHGVGLLEFIFCLVFIVFFVALAVYDLRWFLLPDRLVFSLVAVAAVEVVSVAIWQHSWAAAWQPAAGALIIFGLFYGLFQVSKGVWIGGGDVKLAIALGLIVASPLRAFLVIFFASLLGTLASLPQLGRGKQGLKTHIPFGPYLLAATLIVLLSGTHIVDWYVNLLAV